MASRRTTAGLSAEDLERIRQVLATGRKPRVVFTEAAGQIAGQIGQVVELTDPALSDEWLVVRFGHDELPFSPADLALPSRADSRGDRGRRSGRPSAVGTPAPQSSTTVASAPTGGTAPSVTEERTVATVDTTSTVPAQPSRTRAETTGESAPASAPARAGGRQSGRAGRGKAAAPAMTVTLTYQEGTWTVTVLQGTRNVVKAAPVPAGKALPALTGLGVPEVDEALEKLVAAERAEVEHRAEQLRTELAQVEARLAELSRIPLA